MMTLKGSPEAASQSGNHINHPVGSFLDNCIEQVHLAHQGRGHQTENAGQRQVGNGGYNHLGDDIQSHHGNDRQSQLGNDRRSQFANDRQSQQGNDIPNQLENDGQSQQWNERQSQQWNDRQSQQCNDRQSQQGNDRQSHLGKEGQNHLVNSGQNHLANGGNHRVANDAQPNLPQDLVLLRNEVTGREDPHESYTNASPHPSRVQLDDLTREGHDIKPDTRSFTANDKSRATHGVIGMIGSGDYGRALAGRIAQSGYTVLLGSRNPDNPQIRQMLESKSGTRLVSQEEAAGAEVVVVAVASDHYDKLPYTLLHGKLLVDVANWTRARKNGERSIAEGLQDKLPRCQVVKAFNVLSAYALENNTVQSAKQVPVASDYPAAKSRILKLVQELGFTPVDYGDLSRARDIEDIPVQLLPKWKGPGLFVGILWMLHFLVLMFKYQICSLINNQGESTEQLFSHLGLLNFNRATAITALWTLSLCYLPGLLGAYLQLWRGTKYRRFPQWLDTWLRGRKQLGLLMLGLAAIHTILGSSVWSARYDTTVFENPIIVQAEVAHNDTAMKHYNVTLHNGLMTWQGELFMTTGTLSLMLTIVLGVSSLPSVGASLSWREFMFIQSKLGWLALLFATAHDLLLGFGFRKEDYRSCFITSGAQYALHLPLLTILLKVPLLLPCVDRPLMAIRGGQDRVPSMKPPSRIVVQPMDDTRARLDRRRGALIQDGILRVVWIRPDLCWWEEPSTQAGWEARLKMTLLWA